MKVRIGPYRKNRAERVEIEPYDTWSMDCTLALIVHPMLVQLKETKHGAPNVDNKDVPENLRMPDGWYEENYTVNGETDENFFKRWDWVLDEMIWAFEYKAKDMDAGDMCADKCANFGDPVCKACLNETQERLTNAFKLFGKYYENLWD
jgi:hypothetical protein